MRREYAYRVAITTFSFVLAFAACEFVYRLVTEGANKHSESETGNQYHFYVYDAELGWANKPGVTGVFRRAEFSYTISINDLGMRQTRVFQEKAPGAFRIVVLGDSFLWGIGVSDDERISELLERQLNGVEVLNLGVAGYGPVQYSLMLGKVLGFSPDLVIVLFCLSNDFADNVLFQRYGYYKPYAELGADGTIVIKGIPPPNVRTSGFAVSDGNTLWGSRMFGDLRQTLAALRLEQKGLIGFDSELIYTNDGHLTLPQRQLKHQAIQINEALLGQLAGNFASRGIPLLVVPAPTKREYTRGSSYGHERYFFEAETILLETSRRLGIPSMQTVSSLDGYDFWQQDGHWKPQGHKKMAGRIASFLRTHRLARPNVTMRRNTD